MSKVAILSVATGLSFISIFAILSMILIPHIDSIKHNSNVDRRLNLTKLKKFIKRIIKLQINNLQTIK